MSIQHLFAYSSQIDSAAVAAGAPYGCGSISMAKTKCEFGGVPVDKVVSYA